MTLIRLICQGFFVFKQNHAFSTTTYYQMIQFQVKSLQELPEVAGAIIEKAKNYKIWLLEGEMGAGKTTLSKALAHHLQVQDEVNSPTFAIVNEYLTAQQQIIYHIDCYRLEDEQEALQIGIDDYLHSGHYCWIEWSQRIIHLLQDIPVVKIHIFANEAHERIITLSLP
jgi:tRNA threonylcarbamoyladenosine biosynthesis protein TsaE